MQEAGGGFAVARHNQRQALQRFFDCLVYQGAVFGTRLVQHIADDQIAVAGVADAEAQAVEVRRAEFGLNVFQAVVSAVAAAELEADLAAGDVEFVVGDEDFLRPDFIKLRQSGDGFAGEVHVGVGFQKPDFAFGAADACGVAEVFFFVLPHGLPLPGEFV